MNAFPKTAWVVLDLGNHAPIELYFVFWTWRRSATVQIHIVTAWIEDWVFIVLCLYRTSLYSRVIFLTHAGRANSNLSILRKACATARKKFPVSQLLLLLLRDQRTHYSSIKNLPELYTKGCSILRWNQKEMCIFGTFVCAYFAVCICIQIYCYCDFDFEPHQIHGT